MLFFFFFHKLPHSLDVSFLIVWDEAQFSGEARRLSAFSSPPFVHSHVLSLRFFSWELRFKSLTNVFVWRCHRGTRQLLLSGRGNQDSGSQNEPIDQFSFLRSNVFQKEPIFGFRHLYLLNRAFFLFPSCCRSSTFCWIFTKMLAFWRGLPDFFLHGRFCMK